jgi:hypothetical protein
MYPMQQTDEAYQADKEVLFDRLPHGITPKQKTCQKCYAIV